MNETKDFLFEQNDRFLNEVRAKLTEMLPGEPACNIDAAALEVTAIFAKHRNEFSAYLDDELRRILNE